MGAVILDGRGLAGESLERCAPRAAAVTRKLGRRPRLVALLIGADDRSRAQADLKRRRAEAVGVEVRALAWPGPHTPANEAGVLETIRSLNADRNVDGVFVHLPLPRGWNEVKVATSIAPPKDIDPLDAEGRPFPGCTPAGVTRLLAAHGVNLAGKSALLLFGSPLAALPFERELKRQGIATATASEPAPDRIRGADVVVTALGRPRYLRAEWVKPGAAVIDAAYSGGPVGDVDPGVAEVAGYLAPVPGGVGPMTVAMLIEHTIEAAERR